MGPHTPDRAATTPPVLDDSRTEGRNFEAAERNARSILATPVARGLVVRPQDYPWGSFNHWLTGKIGRVEIESPGRRADQNRRQAHSSQKRDEWGARLNEPTGAGCRSLVGAWGLRGG